jgi:xanthine dehydrogenase accessory factor
MLVLVRGGGDIATGVSLRLYRTGYPIIISELSQPLAVRRGTAFSEAVHEGEWAVEGVTARRVESVLEARRLVSSTIIPVVVAPDMSSLTGVDFDVVVDARLTKRPPETDLTIAPLVIGLGPGFVAGVNCHGVVETKRGHTLGRVYWTGSALADTATPQGDPRRVLRSPADGLLTTFVEIGQSVEAGQAIAEVGGQVVAAPLSGTLRGLIRPGTSVTRGLKIGDVDSRGIKEYCFMVSDRALAVGGGVLEALLTKKTVTGAKNSTTPGKQRKVVVS